MDILVPDLMELIYWRETQTVSEQTDTPKIDRLC